MTGAPLRLLLPAVVLESAFIGLVVLGPLRNSVVEAITILLGSSAVYLISTRLILKDTQSSGEDLHLLWIVVPALLFRLTAFPLDPAFTDDLNRYRWEARVGMAGGSPYEASPSDPAWAGLRDETWSRIPGLDFRAVYGPFTEIVYRWAYSVISKLDGSIVGQIFWLKSVSALFELGVLAGLWQLLRAANLPLERILIYAWSPLPVFEFWGNGHNDTLALCPLVWALWAAAKERWNLSFALLGVAAAAKVWPLALLPLFIGWSHGRPVRWKQSLLTPLTAMLFMLPYGMGPVRNTPFLSGFLGGWRNNDSVYGLLLWFWGDQYAAKYTAFALVALATALLTLRGTALTKSALAAIAAMLFVSSNCHPWYLSWVLILLPLHPSLGLLLWTALIPIAYQALPGWEILGQWNGSTPLRWCIYIPVMAVLLYELARLLRERKVFALP